MCETQSYFHFMCIDDKRYTGSFRPKQLTSSIKGTILTVIKLSGRTTPPSHLYCNVLFFVIELFIYLFFYILQISVQRTLPHWNCTIKAHWDLYESTERAWFVSYSLCPFVPCAEKRWEGAEMIEELDLVLCVCVDREDWIWQDDPTQRPLTHADL